MESTSSSTIMKKINKNQQMDKILTLLLKTRLGDTACCEAQNGLVHPPHMRLDFETAYWMESLRLQSRNTQVSAFHCSGKEKESKPFMPTTFHRKTPSICELRNRAMAVTHQPHNLLHLYGEIMV